MRANAEGDEPKLVEALADAGRAVLEKRLTWGTAGNISARCSATEFLISASGRALDRLGADGLTRCALEGAGSGPARAPQPSVETALHRAVYRARPDVGAVLHASPFHATLVASSALALDANLSTDTAYYVREVRRVPFHAPGSDELAEAVAALVAGCDALLLDNHGALTLGATPAEAVTRLEALELLCRMAVYGALGIPLRPLSADQASAFVAQLATRGTV